MCVRVIRLSTRTNMQWVLKKRKKELINKTYRRLMSYINCRILLSFIKCEDEDLKTRAQQVVARQSNGWSERKKKILRWKIFLSRTTYSKECWIETSKDAVTIVKRKMYQVLVRPALCLFFVSLRSHHLSQQIYHCHRVQTLSIRCNRFILIFFRKYHQLYHKNIFLCSKGLYYFIFSFSWPL